MGGINPGSINTNGMNNHMNPMNNGMINNVNPYAA